MKTVIVVGLGYVGLPLACLCAEKGLKVYGLDVDSSKVDSVNKSQSPIEDEHIADKLKNLKNKIHATTNANECIPISDVVIVCVPTPVDHNNSPDITALMGACSTISKFIKHGTLLVIESTIYPGTIEEVVLPILQKQNLDAYKNDLYVAHCPERIDPGNKKWTIEILPRVVGGITKESTKKAAEFYRSILNAEVLELSSVKAAEATKIMENTFRDVNIAFVNEMAQSFDKAGIDILEVIKGASTKPFAFIPHYPGAGVGGHCFDRNEWLFVKNEDSVYPIKIGELYELLKYYNETNIGDTQLVRPGNLEVLSFDLINKKSCYKPIKLLSKRPYQKMLNVKASCNYSIKVTDKHPMVVFNNGFTIKPADQLSKNDKLVVSLKIPELENYTNKKREYKKSGKNYTHNSNTAGVAYFTSSSRLKQQVMLMLEDTKLIPNGVRNMSVLQDIFLGSKQEKLRQYLENVKKIITYSDVEIFDTFAAIKIQSIGEFYGDYAYSLEVEETGTIVTTNGLVMHNCISVDPYYLIEKAKQLGFNHRFLILAREINNGMPHYTVELLEHQLQKLKKKLAGAKVGVLGMSYKGNVDDIRESPSFDIINILKTKGADVFVYDPHVKEQSNVKDLDEFLNKSDYIILATDHKEFKAMDLEKLKKHKIHVVIDGRNCLDKEKIKSMGILYHGIGRS